MGVTIQTLYHTMDSTEQFACGQSGVFNRCITRGMAGQGCFNTSTELSSSLMLGQNSSLKTHTSEVRSSVQSVFGGARSLPSQSWFPSYLTSSTNSSQTPRHGGDKPSSEKECRQVFFDC